MASWPHGFLPIPDEEWTVQPLGDLARKYDTVEQHGWYDNLDRSVEQIQAALSSDDLLLDYSGGTGILTRRLLQRMGSAAPGVLIADSSPKFLRLALERSRGDARVGFRLIRYLRDERRLQTLAEVLPPALQDRGFDGLVSTNAIHLYYGLEQTLRSWWQVLRAGGRAFVQSGNIDNPEAAEGTWIIDETVEHIHRAAQRIVARDSAYAEYRECLNDAEYVAAHDALRRTYFQPVRPLSVYIDQLEQAGFVDIQTEARTVEARVADWCSFVSVYHEGVLGWVGGAAKITGSPASPRAIEHRKGLIELALEAVFEGRETFDANWTYITCHRPG